MNNKPSRTITYNNYVVLNIYKINGYAWIKTCLKETREVFWFFGPPSPHGETETIRRLLDTTQRIKNGTMKKLFADDVAELQANEFVSFDANVR